MPQNLKRKITLISLAERSGSSLFDYRWNMSSEVPFFARQKTREFIAVLGRRDPLILFLGGGVSAESGLPSWQTLIERILHKAAEREVEESSREDFVQGFIKQHGLLTTAAVAQSVLGPESTIATVRHALYDRVSYNPEPGFFAEIVAELVVQQIAGGHRDVPIVTTNYDQLIETAIIQEISAYNNIHPGDKITRKPVSVVSESDGQIPEDGLPVFHIHGCVEHQWTIESTGNGTIILGERDYAQLQHQGSYWQDNKVSELLASDGTCLFAGMSLADPNIIRYLTVPRPEGESGDRYALLCSQTERQWVRSFPPKVIDGYDTALERRLWALNVKPIVASYYLHVAQFISEVLLYRSVDGWSDSLWYDNRLASWRVKMMQAVLPEGDNHQAFRTCQEAINRELQRVVDKEIIPLIESDALEVGDAEILSLELWFRNPEQSHRSLELWGSSVQMWSSYENLAKPPIAYDSTYTAVQAFISGGHQFRRNGRPGSRWQYQLAQPIRLPEEPWFNLPVGATVLSSSIGEDDSCLAKLRLPAQRELMRVILEVGKTLCEPEKMRAIIASG